MSFYYFGNVPSSVPKVMDTTPCMNEMLNYEDCVHDGNIIQQEVIHPNWPSIFPRLLTDGKLIDFDDDNLERKYDQDFSYMKPLTKKDRQYLWECEEERFVYKACLRTVIGMRRNEKHTSWETAEVANLQLT